MNKKKLISFIEKYYLAGNTSSVKVVSDGTDLVCNFLSDDQNVVGTVTMKDVKLSQSELGVYTTGQLLKLLSALDDTIEISVNSAGDKAFSLSIKDSDTRITYMLADLAVIRQAPNMKNMPNFDVNITIDSEFLEKFIKSKKALPESENFAVKAENGEADIIINHSSLNTNRVTFKTKATVASNVPAICFSSNLMKEILVANKTADKGSLEVSNAGLARVSFTKDGEFESTYFLVQLQSA